jgi:hypothetical protein
VYRLIVKNYLQNLRNYGRKKIHKAATTLYLFLKYRWQILTSHVYLYKLNLDARKLIIQLDTRSLVSFPTFIYPVLNTSIAVLNKSLIAVSRISNAGFEDTSDRIGRPIQLYRKNQSQLQNGIIKFNLSHDGTVSNLEFLHKVSAIPNYEDPRIFFLHGQEYLVMTEVTSTIGISGSAFKCGVVIENLETKQIMKLRSPYGKGIEKNWVPVENNNSITLLYSSNPVTLIKFDADGPSHELISTLHKSKENLNNRTQVIRTPHPEIPFIRVASKKFAVSKYGYTPLHYFEILSEDLQPLSLSRPFIFSSRKQEYCQGIAIIDSKIYLSWSEQEKYSYIGSIEISKVIELFS